VAGAGDQRGGQRYRRAQGIDGALFLGRDTHQLSQPAFRTILDLSCWVGGRTTSLYP
jgi:hypothetical protein